jgi:hypothetical protein
METWRQIGPYALLAVALLVIVGLRWAARRAGLTKLDAGRPLPHGRWLIGLGALSIVFALAGVALVSAVASLLGLFVLAHAARTAREAQRSLRGERALWLGLGLLVSPAVVVMAPYGRTALVRAVQGRHVENELLGPDLVVAEARSAAIGDTQLLEDVGVETGRGVFTPLLKKGTPVPCEDTETFHPTRDAPDQVTVSLFRGAGRRTSEVTPIGRFVVRGFRTPSWGVPSIALTVRATRTDLVLFALDQRLGMALQVARVGPEAPQAMPR